MLPVLFAFPFPFPFPFPSDPLSVPEPSTRRRLEETVSRCLTRREKEQYGFDVGDDAPCAVTCTAVSCTLPPSTVGGSPSAAGSPETLRDADGTKLKVTLSQCVLRRIELAAPCPRARRRPS